MEHIAHLDPCIDPSCFEEIIHHPFSQLADKLLPILRRDHRYQVGVGVHDQREGQYMLTLEVVAMLSDFGYRTTHTVIDPAFPSGDMPRRFIPAFAVRQIP